jgi:predicted Zn-dependent protease
MRPIFPIHLQKTRDLMPQLLETLEKGRENDWYAFVWLEESNNMQYISANTESASESSDRGIVMRIFVDGQNFEKSSNQLDPESLISMAKKFRSEIDSKFLTVVGKGYKPISWNAEKEVGMSNEFISQLKTDLSNKSEVHLSPNCKQNPFDSDIEKLKEIATNTRANLLKITKKNIEENSSFEDLADIKTMIRQNVLTHVFVDREKNMSQVIPTTVSFSMGMTQAGQVARAIAGGLGGLELTELSEEDKIEVTFRSLQLAKAKKLAPGRYKVISGPDVTGVIAHEAFGHTQEGDTWMKGRSIAMDLHHSKTKVGNDQASIINHPDMFSMDDMDHGTNGSYFFDHEGQLARPQTILDKGMLSSPMTDLTSATKLNVPRTANGKRESWRRPLMARQTNTYFTAGDKTVDELIGMVDDGYLARWASGGMEDPKGGSLTAGTSYLEEIKDGKLTGEIYLGPSGGHVELSDPVFTLLDRIVAKSKSAHDDNVPDNKLGGCGKYHKEGVPAGCGGPFILWESITCG